MATLHYNIHPRIEAFTTGIMDTLPYYVLQPHQVHGDKIAIIYDKDISRNELNGIDALITNLADCPIAVRTADCVPILVYDPVKNVIAAVHSGWKGTVKRIAQKVIKRMNAEFGTNPKDLLAAIGPSIGPESFFVHNDVNDAFLSTGSPMHEV